MGRISLTSGVLAVITLALVFGPEVGLAADYQDAKHNVCEGNRVLTEGCPEWGKHVTGQGNVALGDGMMSALTSGEDNFAAGFFALRADTTGSKNLAIGAGALASNTTGNHNVADGVSALETNTTGLSNNALGEQALVSNTTGASNVAAGFAALVFNISGSENVGLGTDALRQNKVGSSNVAVGHFAGAEVRGSNNIDISNEGVSGDEGTTRIGTAAKQTRAFVAGIYNKPVGASACVVNVNPEGQLGCNGHESSTAVATFSSRKAVPSGNCLAYTGIAPAGRGACAAKTAGFSNSTRLAPAPANGATVTNLYADTSASVTGADTALVAVIDNTTGATLLSCTVTATNKNTCTNTTESGVAAAGENIEVKITASGESATNKLWRVTFRY